MAKKLHVRTVFVVDPFGIAERNRIMTSPPTSNEYPDTNELLEAMLSPAMLSSGLSDLFFSPNRRLQIAQNGLLVFPDVSKLQAPSEKVTKFLNKTLTASDTRRIANDLLGANKNAQDLLKSQGACDFSYSPAGASRLRVNIFTQRGTYAIVMRVVPYEIRCFKDLNLPPLLLTELMKLKSGIVLITGLTGSGKSSTLAAIIQELNENRSYHIVTIEDPVEFIHRHNNCIIHQREVHSDTPSFSHGLRAALRQSPNVILLGEMRDRETTEMALEAAETGHLVFSTLHTIDASKTVDRIIGAFPVSEQQVARIRLANTFQWIVSQRLISRKDGAGRVPMVEILRSWERTREYIVKGEHQNKAGTLLEAIRDDADSLCFDDHLMHLVNKNIISESTALANATDPHSIEMRFSGINVSVSISNFLKEEP